ncbi:alpha/beta hydrolase fold domain-containing protein [Kitasatospora mediocidica]|uniref:alpha/beta hydrolase fold domain-containing protein n=1 Tax=Kitasatospora mediocidica TaxID=58352 RepID=UPI0005607757|nr:alpha/beta hydrolase fold domain-containing protein [Kitasatospora mediocidica]
MEDRSVLTRPTPGPDLTLRHGHRSDQVADAWLGDARAARRPLAVLVHGGFWRPDYDRTHARAQGGALRAAGWTVVSVEYRRTPGAPDLAVRDVAAALAAVPEALADAAPAPHNGSMVVLGHSAGGHLALWSAAAAPAPGLLGTIALAPVADLDGAHRLRLDGDAVAAFLGGPPQDRPDLDPALLATPVTPVVIVHGDEDEVVPVKTNDAYARAHPATRRMQLTGAGHFALIDPLSAAWPLVVGALAVFNG